MGSGQGPDQEGSCEGGPETDLDAESNNGARASGSCVRKATGWGRTAGRKQGWEQRDRWEAAQSPGSGRSEDGGKCRMGSLSRLGTRS